MEPPSDALASLQRAVKKSQRSATVRFPISYVRRGDADSPTVARMLHGGRGGEVRLKVHLTLAMQATKHPYTLKARTARGIAIMLGLPDDLGTRRVNDALKWLDNEKLLLRTRHPGKPGEFALLNPDGSGDAWPATQGARYLAVPIEMWSQGWILKLNGRSLGVYLALIELVGGRKNPDGEFMDAVRKRQYGFSDDTWTRATKELEDLHLIVTTSELWGDDQLERRRRKRYLPVDLRDIGPATWK